MRRWQFSLRFLCGLTLAGCLAAWGSVAVWPYVDRLPAGAIVLVLIGASALLGSAVTYTLMRFAPFSWRNKP